MKQECNNLPNGTIAIGSDTGKNNDVFFSALESIDRANFNVTEVSTTVYNSSSNQ